MTAHTARYTNPQPIEGTTIPVWVTSVDYAGGGVAHGRGKTPDGISVDFAGEPRALWAISEALDAGDGPVLAAIPTWWSILLRQFCDQQDPGRADLADWLRAQMRERHLTQRQVAWRAGVDQATVSRLLGGRVPTARTLARLARVLGWPPFEAVDRAVPARGQNRLADGAGPARPIRMATLGPEPVEGQAESWQRTAAE